MKIERVLFRPPLAVGRLGGAATPMDSYRWREDPTVHGAARNVIEPALSLEVYPDGSVAPFQRFRNGDKLRPVTPFFELWATVVYGAADPPGSAAPGAVVDVPLTRALLESTGGRLEEVVFSLRVTNRKAARRTGDDINGRMLSNRVTAFDLSAIRAKVSHGKSWVDNKDCIVLEYSQTSFLAREVRNESRIVAPAST